MNNTSNSANALSAFTTGSGNAFRAATSESGNALRALATGSGQAGVFEVDNTSSSAIALEARTNGTAGDAFFAENTGSGRAGNFEIDNASNVSPALRAQTNGGGSALNGISNGSGPALSASATGGGNAIDALATGSGNAIDAISGGGGDALRSDNTGAGGNAGDFRINNQSNSNAALYAETNGTGNAGRFEGDVQVNGTLNANSKNFKIDHPQDPTGQYLKHAAVESPRRLTTYTGNVTLGSDGETTVQLPDYFEALNRNYRYQLTAIGGAAPRLHVAEEINGGTFRIAGGKPGMKVSWRVTAVRDDAWARENALQVEEEKPSGKQGTYVNPEAHGASQSRGEAASEQPREPGSSESSREPRR